MSSEPGNARSIAVSAARIGVFGDTSFWPGSAVVIESSGAASAARMMTAVASEVRGWFVTPAASACHIVRRRRDPLRRRRGHSRPRSIRSPSSASIAGSTVSDPTTAIATTRIAPSAIEVNTPKPVNSSPASPITTVIPATRIARPTVAEVAASAASAVAPSRRSTRSRRM